MFVGQDPIGCGERNRHGHRAGLQRALSKEIKFYLGRVRAHRRLWKREWGRRKV